MRSVLRSVFFLLLLLILLCASALGQDVSTLWTATYNDPENDADVTLAVNRDSSNNLIVLAAIARDFGILKYSRTGQLLWVKTIGFVDYGTDWPAAMSVDDAGNIYVTGSSESGVFPSFHKDFMTVKLNTSGDTVWVRRFNGPANRDDVPKALALDPEGNVIVSGSTTDSLNGVSGVVIKYCGNGDLAWVRQYVEPGTVQSRVQSLCVGPDGSIYVAGTMQFAPTGYDIVVVKFDSSGSFLWASEFDDPFHGNDVAVAAELDNSGNLFVAGASKIGEGTEGNNDIVLLRLSPDGTMYWDQTYDGLDHSVDVPVDMVIDPDGNAIVAGYSYRDSHRTSDFLTIKYSPGGQILWSATYNGMDQLRDVATDLAIDGRGSIYVTGVSLTGGNSWSYAIVKYYRSGSEAWTMHYGGTNGWTHYDPRIVAEENTGGVFVVGTAEYTADYLLPDIVALKYQQLFCCSGPTGNVDRDGRNLVDISDLTLLITYLFGSPTPTMPCREEAILDGQTDITITDLQLLAEYLFSQGPATLPTCP